MFAPFADTKLIRHERADGVASAAALSAEPDKPLYRYALVRVWGREVQGVVCWVMLNPSTADALEDDPTIKRCMGYGRQWGYGGMIVVNLWAYRETNPKRMVLANVMGKNIVGPENNAWIRNAVRASGRTVVAWGANARSDPVLRASGRADYVTRLILKEGVRPLCLRLTADGDPYHPLYQRADIRPVPFPIKSCRGTDHVEHVQTPFGLPPQGRRAQPAARRAGVRGILAAGGR